MNLKYQTYNFTLELEKTVKTNIYPPFILRSVLGMNLKKLCCIFKQYKNCEKCPVNQRCAYSFIFESIIDKENKVFKGINKAPHPFIISADYKEQETLPEINFDLTLAGEANSYFPYIFQAFKLAGEQGLFKDRIKYKISAITANKKHMLDNDDNLHLVQNQNYWKMDYNESLKKEQDITLSFKAPFRLQKENKVVNDFKFSELLQAAFRRIYELSAFYGENQLLDNPSKIDFEAYNDNKKITKNLYYKNYKRYSARQKNVMKIGGIMGQYTISGTFTKSELSLLQIAQIFSIGKNTGFGFGNVTIMEN